MKKKNKHTKKTGTTELPSKGRRDFLTTAWKGLGIVAGLEYSGLTIHYLLDRKVNIEDNNLFEAGLPDEFPKQSITPFRQGHFYLVRLGDGGFLALSIKCPHLGCAIRWDEKSNEFNCPCHSSKFDVNGDVLKPPAPRALAVYDIEIVEGKLFVNLNKKSKRQGFDKSQLTYV